MEAIIETKKLVKNYKMGKILVSALKGVDVKISKGEFVAIMGPSGSGKSTLMHILGCLDTPTKGDYVLNGELVSQHKKNKLAKIRNNKIGFVFQTFNLLPYMDINKNVALPLMYAGFSTKDRLTKAEKILKKVGLGNRLNHKPSELSGGQRQRVAIARALVNNPDIILADEPTGNLDTNSGGDILSIFKKLHQEGNTIIMVTHDPKVAEAADRVIYIQDGFIKDAIS